MSAAVIVLGNLLIAAAVYIPTRQHTITWPLVACAVLTALGGLALTALGVWMARNPTEPSSWASPSSTPPRSRDGG